MTHNPTHLRPSYPSAWLLASYRWMDVASDLTVAV